MAWSSANLGGSNVLNGPTRNALFTGQQAATPQMVDTGAAGLAMALPAAASALSAISPVWGAIAQGFAGIPGQMIDYQNRKSAAEAQNANVKTAFNILSRVPTEAQLSPLWGKIDPRPAIVSQLVDRARANQNSKAQFASDTMSKMAASGIPETARLAVLDKGIRSMDADMYDKAVGDIERGREYTTNLRLTMTQADEQRVAMNMQRANAVAGEGITALGLPMSVADFAANMANIWDAVDKADEKRLAERQMQLQEQANRQANERAWASMGLNTAIGGLNAGVGFAQADALSNLATAVLYGG